MQNKIKKWISVLLTAVIVFTTTMTDYFTGECQTVLAQEQTDGIMTAADIAAPRMDLYAKAEELKTPLAIYNYVRNNINYEYYGDMRKGAEAAYDSLAGNDVDIACLLSEMLNAAGYETRYVSGTIRIDEKIAAGMTGKDLKTAAHIFALSGYSVSIVDNEEGGTVYFEIPHTWIECYLPYTDYRGAGNCGGEYVWVPMDAGIKTYEDVDSIYDHTAQIGSTEAFVKKFVEEHSQLYIVSRKIAQQELAYLPLSLPYETVGEINRSEEYNGAEDSITFVLGPKSSITFRSRELYNKRLTLVYTEQDGLVRPELKLDGKTVAAGSLMEKGSEHHFTMTVQSGNRKNVIENTLYAGGIHAIVTDTQTITSKELEKVTNELKTISSSVSEKNIYTDEYLGVLLDYAGKMYFAQVDIADRIMAEEMEISQARSLSVGMLGYRVIPEYENGELTGIADGTLYTDIDLDFHMAASNNGNDEDVKQYMLASGMMSSAYESAIWEEITGQPSVSTVSILNEAYESDNPILAITDKNANETLKTLSVTPNVLSAVKSEVLAGKLVIIPQNNVTIGDWSGTAYIVLEKDHYTGQYMINGGLAGGSTNGGSGSFTVGSAYLVNLIAASVDMAESLGLTELALAGLELGGVIGSLLGVGTLLLCVTLFVLAVEEYKANMDNLFAYQSGDESAGEAIVVNAGINIAVTAAFSGASYLAKTQLAKYAVK
ncbi:MAG: transglutaminase-like domain-containing protein, partial [Alistipes sp.]|nr:transglutaminase-like domain-containing protein [Alistipes sp.]